jgi:hypothetical protein
LADAALTRVFQAADLDPELQPRFFRFPYLETGDRLRRRVAWTALKELGYVVAGCDANPADWRLPFGTITLDAVERRTLAAVSVICTGIRIVRPLSAMARVIDWRIHHTA